MDTEPVDTGGHREACMQPQELDELRWHAEMTAADKPHGMSVRARGALDGRGEWRFRQEGEWVVVTYDWIVLVTRPWMIALAPVLGPLFVWNHKRAMQRGFEGLTRELARRAAAV